MYILKINDKALKLVDSNLATKGKAVCDIEYQHPYSEFRKLKVSLPLYYNPRNISLVLDIKDVKDTDSVVISNTVTGEDIDILTKAELFLMSCDRHYDASLIQINMCEDVNQLLVTLLYDFNISNVEQYIYGSYNGLYDYENRLKTEVLYWNVKEPENDTISVKKICKDGHEILMNLALNWDMSGKLSDKESKKKFAVRDIDNYSLVERILNNKAVNYGVDLGDYDSNNTGIYVKTGDTWKELKCFLHELDDESMSTAVIGDYIVRLEYNPFDRNGNSVLLVINYKYFIKGFTDYSLYYFILNGLPSFDF